MKIDSQNILEKIKTVKIAVFGDLCLDAYWIYSISSNGRKGAKLKFLLHAVPKGYQKNFYSNSFH